MSRRLKAQLSNEQIEEVARKVLHRLKGPDDGTILLLDEKPEETPVREARIAFKMCALDFDTRNEYEEYKKTHEIEQGTEIHIKEEEQKSKKPEEPSGKQPSKPGEKPEDKKPGEKPEGGKPKVEKPYAEVELKDVLEKAVGEHDIADWNTHPLHESQLTRNVSVKFPDGSSKKYKDLTDEEKARVQAAVKNNKVAHKGMNDYTKVDKDTLVKNMANNLGRYEDKGVQESKNESTEPVTKENVEEFTKSVTENAGSVLKKYASAMSKISRPMAERHLKDMTSTIKDGFDDGSLKDVSQADLDEFCRDEMKRMIHQEVETRRRSLGDHGIRHLAGNSKNTMSMLNELKGAGMKITGKDKLMGLSIQANHDMGYTVGEPATTFGGSHKDNSAELVGQEEERYAKVFGKDSVGKIKEIIRTHDDPEIDWDNEPLKSAVRLSDNISLFNEDKVQDLFIRSPKAMEQACKLRLAAEIEPPKPQQPKEKNFKLHPEEYSKATEQYKADMEEYQKPETQQKVKGAKSLQEGVKKQLHKIVDEEDFDENDKELMHSQIDEMGEGDFSTTVDILSRYSGRIQGMNFDKDSKVMNVNMKYSPEGQITDSLFGDKVAARQFSKFVEALKGKPIGGKRGQTEFESKGKPVARLNIEDFDKEPEETATTEAMKAFAEKTVRGTLTKVRREILPPPGMVTQDVDKAFKYMQEARDKFTDDEWGTLETVFKTNKDNPKAIAKFLTRMPLLESEEQYLHGKTASIAKRLVASIMEKESVMNIAGIRKHIMASMATMSVYRRLAQLSEEEKQEVIDKVKERMHIKDEDVPGNEPEETSETPEESEKAPEESVETPEADEEAESAVERAKERLNITDEETEQPEESTEGTEEPAEESGEPKKETVEDLEEGLGEPDDEDEELDDEDEDEELGEGDEKDKINEIVEGLVDEVKTIKEDGHISPAEVLGLIKNMMEMVNLLVEAKPPARRRKTSGTVREFVIAERVLEMKGRRTK